MIDLNVLASIGPVLVTGCSSGIGKYTCQFLAERGVKVFATARKLDDLVWVDSLDSSSQGNVISVQLDVTSQDSIKQAVKKVKETGLGLFGLVNNAGIGSLGYHPTFTEQELFDIFNINVFGPWRVTNAFLDLLLESKGRVVNIGSQGGNITKKLYGPYSMTKYALEAYTESLRSEIEEFGLTTSIVQPGGIISSIGEKGFDGFVTRLKRAKVPFKAEADSILASFTNSVIESNVNSEEESETNRKPSSPEIVANAIADALTNAKPKRRYLVGTTWEGNRVIHALIEKLIDENNNPQHHYTISELSTMLANQKDSIIESDV